MNAPRAASRLSFVVLAALVLVSRAPFASAAEEVLRDEWESILINGARSGHTHEVVRRVADGNIETTSDTKISIKRGGASVEMGFHNVTVERPDGTLVSNVAKSKMSAVETTTRMDYEKGKAKITTETMGESREVTVEMPEDLVGPWRARRIPFEAGYPAGKTFDARVFQKDAGGAVISHTKVVGPEDTEVSPGKMHSLIRLVESIDGYPVITTRWVDKNGTTFKTKASAAGMDMESRRATKEEATAADDGKAQPDLFTSTMILSKVLVPHARTLESALLRVRPRKPDVAIPDLATERQVVEKREAGGAVVLRIGRHVPPAGAAVRPIAVPAPELAPFLAPSSALQSDDPLIVSSAKEAVGDEKDAWKASQAIERWVYKHVKTKSFGVGAASALEVCKSQEGDCSEHAVLAAALARAAGIPSRVVSGLEYLMGFWGGHAWTEVSIAGRWYAIDATNGLGFVDPLHISVSASALAEGTFDKEASNFLSVVGSVDIDVLEVTWNGRTLPVGDPAAVGVTGQRYANRLYDLTLTAPEGFAVEAVVPKSPEDKLAKVTGKTASAKSVEILVRVLDLDGKPLSAPPGGEEVKVDGRTGFVRTRRDGVHEVGVAANDCAYGFSVVPGDEEGKKILAALLATVDLDPVPATTK
jgi:transglutaminase-like putative cysteine protease